MHHRKAAGLPHLEALHGGRDHRAGPAPRDPELGQPRLGDLRSAGGFPGGEKCSCKDPHDEHHRAAAHWITQPHAENGLWAQALVVQNIVTSNQTL